jgi:hypothetical protein
MKDGLATWKWPVHEGNSATVISEILVQHVLWQFKNCEKSEKSEN